MQETFVLGHGAFADSHAFDAVRPLLEARGHRVVRPDVPGHGADRTDAGAITLEHYVAGVRALVHRPEPLAMPDAFTDALLSFVR